MLKYICLITTITIIRLYMVVGHAQPYCSFTHYSSDNGLSQNTVMAMLQDRKGNMWFSTWDGINKFDGYTFKTYKARPGNHIELTNNRIDFMKEDEFGYIWLLTYDSKPYRFNPRTESFEKILSKQNLPDISSVRLLNHGIAWLLTEHQGAIRVKTDSITLSLEVNDLRTSSQGWEQAHVYDVWSDFAGREWILTDKGLALYNTQRNQAEWIHETHFNEGHPHQQPFFSGKEGEKEIYFGSENGQVWQLQKNTGKFSLLQLNTSSCIIALHNISPEEWLLATRNDGFFIYHTGKKSFTHYGKDLLPESPIVSLYADRNGEIWLEQHVQGTVAHFNSRTKKIKIETVAVEPSRSDRSHPAFQIHEDCYGTAWVHPYGGGFSRYNREKNCLEPFYNSIQKGEWRFSNKIHSAFSDRQGNLWLCTHSKGLEKITFRPMQFQRLIREEHNYESLSNEVRALLEDCNRNFWIGLKDGKLRVYDSKHHDKGYLTENGTIAHNGRPMQGTAYFLMEDSKKNLWIATKGDGLVKATPQGNRYLLTRYQFEASNPYSLSDDNVYCVYEDQQNRIWVATFGGGVNILTHDKNGKEIFLNHRNLLKNYPQDKCSRVRYITGDHQNRIWIATTIGALTVKDTGEKPEEMHFQHFVRIPDDIQSLSHNDVHGIISTKQNELYLATFGGGLNKLLSLDSLGNARFQSYSVEDGLPSDVLLTIQEDAKGNLWISTENGICKYTPSNGHFEKYNDRSLPFRVRFSEASSGYTSHNHIMFGTNKGIVLFNPDSIRKSSYVPPIVFSNLLVANQNIVPGKESVLQQHLDDIQKLTLSHHENIFTILYAALDFSSPSDIQYAYQLEGFEKNWNMVGEQRSATYTNLPKGHYRFKVRSTNADGIWVDNIRVLDIEILPSFWETPIAYMLYVLILILIVVTAVYILFTIYRLKHRVLMEHQMTDMKLRFFTDISHELRTPLTLIVGPVENVLNNLSLSNEVREQLKVVEKNTNRMLRLINQILDFRKIQNKKMKLRVQCIDLIPFTRRIMDNFEGLAAEKQITFRLTATENRYTLWADADKYEKIIFNLLSNAFKYTPNGKCITVFIKEDEQHISVGVQDQGIGIEENRRKSIFLRFENLAEKNQLNQSSTGIGLSLVNELVEMHQATITVDSHIGQGSCFKVNFLKGKAHYDSTVEFLQDDMTASMIVNKESLAEVSSQEEDNNKELMLLVEDNQELRQFLHSIFSSDYRIVEAEDGMQGGALAHELVPDIIISDVMMPHKDGITLTRELRSDLATSHIPLILLTAKTSEESQLEGLEYGADDYITKPFSATYLKARVKNLLTSRAQLQSIYRTALMPVTAEVSQFSKEENAAPTVEEPQEPIMAPQDKKFMERLMQLMEKNLDNGDLVVDDLVQELAVSRSVFFKKLKTLTGLAPIEFIKEIRINKAIQLIETGEYTMTQISYMVGINDPRYFSKCFKQKMGMTPTEYRDRNKV